MEKVWKMQVKESEAKVLVAQSCLSLCSLCDPMDPQACQAPLYMRFFKQEYWHGLSFPMPGDLPNPGTEPRSPALQEIFYHLRHHGRPPKRCKGKYKSQEINEFLNAPKKENSLLLLFPIGFPFRKFAVENHFLVT